MLKRLLRVEAVPLNTDLARLCLRVVFFGTLFIKHGIEKLFTFGALHKAFLAHHLDPLHIGVLPSLMFATLADGICTLLLVFGLFTRLASVIVFINVFVVWGFVEHFPYVGPGSAHGETLVLYLGGALALFLGGAGKYSIDGLMDQKAHAGKPGRKMAARV